MFLLICLPTLHTGDDGVELGGAADDLHGEIVDVHVREAHFLN